MWIWSHRCWLLADVLNFKFYIIKFVYSSIFVHFHNITKTIWRSATKLSNFSYPNRLKCPSHESSMMRDIIWFIMAIKDNNKVIIFSFLVDGFTFSFQERQKIYWIHVFSPQMWIFGNLILCYLLVWLRHQNCRIAAGLLMWRVSFVLRGFMD